MEDYYLRLSPSTVNSFIYYLEKKDAYKFNRSYYNKKCYENALEQLVSKINGEPFIENEYTLRGKEFENLVSKGEVKDIEKKFKLSKLEQQKPLIKLIDGFCFLGFMDFYDKEKGLIIDTKRVNKYEPDKYANSPQTFMYFYIEPNAKEFKYLIAEEKSLAPVPKGGIDKYLKIETIKRPSDRKIKKTIDAYKNLVFDTLKELDLVSEFYENFSVTKDEMDDFIEKRNE